MITLITGAPGAGKSAALVDLLQSECQRRALYVSGIPELSLPHVSLDDEMRWPELVEDGAAVVIDEVQRVWRPRGAAAKVPPAIAALETHRHRGLDFYLVTQHPKLLDANVRALVGRHVHLRDVGILGRWWYEWPECSNEIAYKAAPVKKSYRLPKKVFGLYKSASLHVKPIRSIPRSVFILGAALAGGSVLAYNTVTNVQARIEGERHAEQKNEPKTLPGLPVAPALPSAAVAAAAVASQAQGRQEVVGCFSSSSTCRCFDKGGFPVVVEWELCKTSAVGYAGLVPLDLTPSDRRQSVPALATPVAPPAPAAAPSSSP